MVSISGIHTRMCFGWETTYGGGSTTFDKVFGLGQKVTTNTETQNAIRVYNIGDPEAKTTALGTFDISLSVETLLTNGWWLRAISGNTATVSGNDKIYVDSAAGKPVNKDVQSMEVRIGYDNPVGFERRYKGVVMSTASLSCSVGEPVRLTFDMFAKTEEISSTLTAEVSEAEEPLHFGHGTLELPSGTTIAKVQSVDLTINRNPEPVRGLGSRFIQQVVNKLTEYELKANIVLQDTSIIEKLWGSSTTPQNTVNETASVKLVFDNGLTGASKRTLLLEFEGVRVNEVSQPLDVEGVVVQECTLFLRRWKKAVWTDNRAAL
jgi:hypothetical protein